MSTSPSIHRNIYTPEHADHLGIGFNIGKPTVAEPSKKLLDILLALLTIGQLLIFRHGLLHQNWTITIIAGITTVYFFHQIRFVK